MKPIIPIMTVLLAALLAIFPGELAAQNNKIQVKGSVTDVDARPIPGATIMVKGNASLGGTITDEQGNFTFSFPAGETLQVTCIGYVTVESRFTRDSDWLVTMDEDAQMLEDVVVVGYGVQKKESVVGSISQVGAESLVNSGTTNITNALAGKLAGVLTFQSSGAPGGSDAEIFVRGVSSWNGSSPLIMVDGVERSFSELDPNEVETISVLKDASATAVFGAKGANGVILVTTKTGQKGKPKMNLTVNYGLETPQELAAIIDAGTTAEMMNVAYMNDGSFGSVMSKETVEKYRSGVDPIRYPSNDWYDLMLNDFAHSLNVNYSLRGGTDRVKYYVAVGYQNEGSLVKRQSSWKNATFNFQKINYRANLDFDVTKSTKLSLKIGS
jgi:TonB-linked SusC/RagA family outer membrane protein